MKKLVIAVVSLSLSLSAIAQQPKRGYRGFVDWDNNFTAYYWVEDEKTAVWFTGVATSHGYQFNPNLFVGGGAMLECSTKYKKWLVPVYAHIRTDQKWGDCTPFGDLRVGYNMCNGGGIYLSPSIGYRFSTGGVVAMNISMGMTLRGASEGTKGMFNFRIGIDF